MRLSSNSSSIHVVRLRLWAIFTFGEYFLFRWLYEISPTLCAFDPKLHMYKKQTIMRRKQISEWKCDTKSKGANSIKCTIFEKNNKQELHFLCWISYLIWNFTMLCFYIRRNLVLFVKEIGSYNQTSSIRWYLQCHVMLTFIMKILPRIYLAFYGILTFSLSNDGKQIYML